MKKWLYPAALLAAIGILSRLPHPAKEISKLEPVRTVYLYMEAGMLCVETDTGDSGAGESLTEATAAMKASADGEIFLDTAEFLLLDPAVPVAEDFYILLRPDCKVAYTAYRPDIKAAADYLSVHTPDLDLADLRMKNSQR